MESFPGSGREREAFLRWRIGKQMPLVPDDARIDYAASAGRGARKVIAAMARRAVVAEYEALFEKAGLKPELVTVPSLTLVNLVLRNGPANGLLLNLEDEILTLVAVTEAGWALYRLKDVGAPGGPEAEERFETVVREAENTIRFLADKEKERVERLWVRAAAAAERPGLVERLGRRIGLPLEGLDYPAPEGWTEAQKALLALRLDGGDWAAAERAGRAALRLAPADPEVVRKRLAQEGVVLVEDALEDRQRAPVADLPEGVGGVQPARLVLVPPLRDPHQGIGGTRVAQLAERHDQISLARVGVLDAREFRQQRQDGGRVAARADRPQGRRAHHRVVGVHERQEERAQPLGTDGGEVG